MKYEKPVVEIINIENEDIIVASNCEGRPNVGSAICISRGRTDERNSMSAMNCTNGSGSWRYDCWITGIGTSCTAYINGITCSILTAGSGGGIGGGLTNCSSTAGAN